MIVPIKCRGPSAGYQMPSRFPPQPRGRDRP